MARLMQQLIIGCCIMFKSICLHILLTEKTGMKGALKGRKFTCLCSESKKIVLFIFLGGKMKPKNLMTMVSFTIIVFACFLMVNASVSAQEQLNLNAKSLVMDIGDTFQFEVLDDSGEPIRERFIITTSDNQIVSVDQKTRTVTADKAGNVTILVESFDGFAYGICDVTVNGKLEKGASSAKSGASYLSLSKSDRAKIKSEPGSIPPSKLPPTARFNKM